MRILYLDIDALRPDHLGCYGYHRNTSPNIDRLASGAIRFENCYASDTPCCPSRTSMFTGRFGVNHGAVCHGGRRAEPFREGEARVFQDQLGRSGWMGRLRAAGYHTATVSSFAERHSAWWWYAGFSEVCNTGGDGMEQAHEVTPAALDWINRRGRGDNWFLHVNFWDVHSPYRTPESFGDPFVDEPIPAWYTEEVRQQHWQGFGPQCARERGGMDGRDEHVGRYPRQPHVIASMDHARQMFDGYDTAVRYVDYHVGLLLDELERLGVLDDTAVIISADHGETLGEMNIYGCHQAADYVTTRLPMIVRWPGLTGPSEARVDRALHYHIDVAATVTELASGTPADNWDGVSFAEALRGDTEQGREHLVLSHMQGSCQRAVHFRRDGRAYHFIRTYHDGLHGFPDVMLFDVEADPHQLHNLADQRGELVSEAMSLLELWRKHHLASGRLDPLETVLAEGGPPHSRGMLPGYLERLRSTGRSSGADLLASRHNVAGPQPVVLPGVSPDPFKRKRMTQRV